MGMFSNMLGSGESLFRDPVPLDYDFLPKKIPHRDGEQQRIAAAIRPLMQERSGRNLILTGRPGVGKTALSKHMLRIMDEETDNIFGLYINCWKHNTSYKVMLELCHLLGLKFVVNKKTSELFELVKKRLNKVASVIIFDEVDKAEDFDFLYMILEDVYNKCIFLITNYPKKIEEMDNRILSRLNPDNMEFHQYNEKETQDILEYRRNFAFVPDVWKDDAFSLVAQKTAQLGDIRTGLYIMREAGTIAEDRASKSIDLEDVKKAVGKVDRYCKNKESDLNADLQEILGVVQESESERIGDLYKEYQEQGGKMSYKTFTRKIKKLSEGQYISTEKSISSEGNTTLIKVNKKLTDY